MPRTTAVPVFLVAAGMLLCAANVRAAGDIKA